MNRYVYLTIIIVGLVTAITRILPFLIFRKEKVPPILSYLGVALSPAIMIILVLYCIRNIDIVNYPYGLFEIGALFVVISTQFLKRNPILSVILGTTTYMIMIRL